jgi:hypothetical protein
MLPVSFATNERDVIWAAVEMNVKVNDVNDMVTRYLKTISSSSTLLSNLQERIEMIIDNSHCTKLIFDRHAIQFVEDSFPLLRHEGKRLLAQSVSTFMLRLAASVKSGIVNLKEI